MAAPSFRALTRHFGSSARKSNSSMAVVDSGATASTHSKVQDEKLPEWSLYEYFWCGPRWRMAFEFADIREKYPKIPAENMDMDNFYKGRQPIKFLGVLNCNVHSVMVKADFKGQEVMKRTMLVMGRDVKQLEAAAERLSKFRVLSSLLKDLIWNRKQQ